MKNSIKKYQSLNQNVNFVNFNYSENFLKFSEICKNSVTFFLSILMKYKLRFETINVKKYKQENFILL